MVQLACIPVLIVLGLHDRLDRLYVEMNHTMACYANIGLALAGLEEPAILAALALQRPTVPVSAPIALESERCRFLH